MSVYRTFEYKGESWDYVYLNPNPKLDREIVKDILWHSIDMIHEGDRQRTLSEEDYGLSITSERPVHVGLISGTPFKAIVETEKGKSGLAILLTRFNRNVLN